MTRLNILHTMEVRLVNHMGDDAMICRAAKVSTIGEASIDSDTAAGLINFLMKNRHGTPFEHGAMTFLIRAPIAVFREFHRHRVGWSYNEESGRYRQLRPDFYIPHWDRPLVQVGKPGAYTFEAGDLETHNAMTAMMTQSFGVAYDCYEAMLDQGVAREVARGVLPVYLYSSMYATCNPRSLMHFLSLRTRDDNSKFPSFPMWEIENVAGKMEKIFAELFPIVWDTFCKNGRVAP